MRYHWLQNCHCLYPEVITATKWPVVLASLVPFLTTTENWIDIFRDLIQAKMGAGGWVVMTDLDSVFLYVQLFFPRVNHFLLSELYFICYFTVLQSDIWYRDLL